MKISKIHEHIKVKRKNMPACSDIITYYCKTCNVLSPHIHQMYMCFLGLAEHSSSGNVYEDLKSEVDILLFKLTAKLFIRYFDA